MRAMLGVVALVVLSGIPAAWAQTPAAPVSIQSAVPDAGSGTVTIAGSGFGARPLVTLDLVPLNVQLALDQRIIAVVPVSMMPPGSYLLTVTRGPQPADTASFDLRIDQPASATPAAVAAPASAAGAAPAATSAPNPSPLPGPADAAARVGDRTFTLAEVDREWQRIDPVGYLSASRQLYDARRRVVTDMVSNELLSREAATRGLTVDALLKEEIPKHTVPLPDNAVTALYESLGTRSRGVSLEQLRPALRAWLARKVEPDLAKMTYIEELTKVSTRADTLLLAPRTEVEHQPDDPALGPETAAVEVVMFGDLQNPTYARYALTVPRIRDLFGARVRFVFKHFPANDQASIAAAEAAACANLQGKFWAFHDALLGQAGALDTARFKQVASNVGIDRATFDPCVDREDTRDRIGASLEETRRYDVPGSPSLLVNGRLAPEPPAFLPPFEFFKRLVEEELARQARDAAAPR
jgi:protein-disulfide isomerase